MRDQGYGASAVTVLAVVICIPAIAALAVALSGLHPGVAQPLPARLIKCACSPDPAMQRLLGIPQPAPFDAPEPDHPQFAPSR